MPPSLGTETSVSQEGIGKKKEGLMRDINKTLKRLGLLCLFIEVLKIQCIISLRLVTNIAERELKIEIPK